MLNLDLFAQLAFVECLDKVKEAVQIIVHIEEVRPTAAPPAQRGLTGTRLHVAQKKVKLPSKKLQVVKVHVATAEVDRDLGRDVTKMKLEN
jgi:hypothetical protein